MVVVSSTFSAPVEGIILQQPCTKLFVNDQELGTGTLYITESAVVWGGGAGPGGSGAAPTLSLQYPTITMHAVQRQPTPVLYMVLSFELRLPELGNVETGSGDTNEDDEFDAEDMPITQLRFMPQNEDDLTAMYSAMSQGQSLHPDPEDAQSDEEDYMDGEDHDEGDEEFEDAEESTAAPEDAASRLRSLRIEHANGNAQYEDEAEDPGELEN